MIKIEIKDSSVTGRLECKDEVLGICEEVKPEAAKRIRISLLWTFTITFFYTNWHSREVDQE